MIRFRPRDASVSQPNRDGEYTSQAGSWNWSATSRRGRELIAPWYTQRWWGVLLCVMYPVAAVAPLAIFTALQPAADRPRMVEAGSDSAIVGFTLLALQFVLAARLGWIEGPFGIDVLMRFHRAVAFVAIALLCAHPFLVAAGNGWGLLIRWRVPWFLWAGRLGLLALLLHVCASLIRRKLPIAYEAWRRWHNLGALSVLGLGFVHSLAIGNDLKSTSGRMVWAGLLAIAVSAWLYSRMLRPLLMRAGWGSQLFRVAAVTPEAPRVWTIALEPVGKRFGYAPGQFQFLQIRSAKISSAEHPFTIASSPARQAGISLTIKESGDFTSNIGLVQPGDYATVHGPFGRFSHTFHRDEQDLVFVAAGVGITPLVSMLRYMADVREPRRVLLVYASRTLKDILFQDELRTMEAAEFPALKVVHVLSDPPADWHGEVGRLDADRVVQLSGDAGGKAFYLCCPPAMMEALIRGLRRNEVSPAHIHADWFSI
jgi:predicted ferric reductase